ncbi:spermidine/putrescine ABC transporter substrate-binding protein [Brevibacillus ruminantium]|uniref:Spermidine/putrescine ABC transporter substrate-binding protein n=1 Tax=Brevibacillus ruminantium TaxID=2950604 RepID=A0ABY4WKL5_9BACL|nr:spermidine/putrescine ABC transporter substrate-binding protein [Brevibacillus ruminantium]USG67627.1 spermidine/putrescine ABC transporter substrate-binding protein [Brevibacillus ruminantium]
MTRKSWTSPLVLLLLLTALLTGVTACSTATSPSAQNPGPGVTTAKGETSPQPKLAKSLNLFIWSEYIPTSVLEAFEKEYGVKVNISTYSSNEEMFAKLAVHSSGYDLAVASDYMIDLMRKQDLMEKLDYENISNIKNIGPEFLKRAADPDGAFSVPYMWGNVVIAINKDKVSTPVSHYRDLLKPEFKDSLVVLDDSRSMIGIANQMQGKSLNETDPAVLEKSKEFLRQLLPNIKAFDSDSPKTLLVTGEVAAGIVYGAEASLARQENPSILTVIPAEGMELWQDNFVIPKGSPNKLTAETFINFVLRPDISAEISSHYPYANPNLAAHELIDKEILQDPAVYPPKSELEKGEYMVDIGNAVKLYDRIWSEIKLE